MPARRLPSLAVARTVQRTKSCSTTAVAVSPSLASRLILSANCTVLAVTAIRCTSGMSLWTRSPRRMARSWLVSLCYLWSEKQRLIISVQASTPTTAILRHSPISRSLMWMISVLLTPAPMTTTRSLRRTALGRAITASTPLRTSLRRSGKA
jgi:hypothetical protein